MKEYIKLISGIVTRNSLKLLFPIFKIRKNRILFSSYNGEQYSCNPKYISEYLNSEYMGEFEIIWSFNNPEKFEKIKAKNSNIKVIRNRSLKWIYYTMTSKFGVTNTGVNSFIPLRKKQCFINTWHGGGCYKKVEGSDERKNTAYINKIKTVANMTSIFLSSSEFFSNNVIRKSFLYNGEILNIGMPRNDILFKDDKNIKNIVRKNLNISSEAFVVLYAPTWRKMKKEIDTDLNFEKLRKSIERKFGRECILLYRAHHFSKKSMFKDDVIDVSEYDDMQQLMCLSDMLITDFSSCIWDYSFTYKPCFLLIPDLNEYKKTVGFEVDIYKWGFPISLSNDELCKNILDFDAEKFKIYMEKHHEALVNYENGNACKIICEKIKNCM